MAISSAKSMSMTEILKPMDPVKAGEPLGDSLKNFLEIAMKIAQIDEAIMSARASAPSQEDAEAFKWHEVSIKALMWTRSSLVEQQSNALGQLKNSAVSQNSSVPPVVPSVPSAAPVSSLSAKAPVFSPTPTKSSSDSRVKSANMPTPSQIGAKVAAGEMTVGSLRDDLERLKEYDAQQCLIIRRIKRLGLGSPEILRQHFATYGGVKEMLISHSFEKKSSKCRADRVRPAALGFIVMDSVDGAQAALRAGPTIMIGGVDVEVKTFEPTEEFQQTGGAETQAPTLKNFQ
jgi:hypothetical protein